MPENTSRVYAYRWVVLSVYMFMTAVSLMFWLSFSSIETYLETQLGFSSHQTIWLAQTFVITYILFSIPSGIFIDKKGFKTGIGVGIVLTFLFYIIRFVRPEAYWILLISQTGIGIAQPFILNAVTKLVTAWFPVREEATAIGLGILAQPVGMALAFVITPRLVEYYGFRGMIDTYSVLIFISIIIFFLTMRSAPPTPPRELSAQPSISTHTLKGVLQSIKFILSDKYFNILSVVIFITFSIMTGLLTRLEILLHELHGATMIEAANLATIFLAGSIFGAVILPMISDKMKKRKIFLNISLIGSLLGVFILFYFKNYNLHLVDGIILGFFLAATTPLIFTMATEMIGATYAGTSIGYLQFMGSVGSLIIVPLMELIRFLTGNFVLSLSLLIGELFIAIIFSYMLKETYQEKTSA